MSYKPQKVSLDRGRSGTSHHHESQSQIFTKFVGKTKVKSQERQAMSLGIFSLINPAMGFSIETSSEQVLFETEIKEVNPIGAPQRYEFILHVVNYGDTTLGLEVWEM